MAGVDRHARSGIHVLHLCGGYVVSWMLGFLPRKTKLRRA